MGVFVWQKKPQASLRTADEILADMTQLHNGDPEIFPSYKTLTNYLGPRKTWEAQLKQGLEE